MRTTNVYKYNELPDALKPKVREGIESMLMECAELDHEVDWWKEQLEELGFYNVEVNYSIGGGQGDGASFTGMINEENAAKLLGVSASEYGDENEIVLRRICHHYSHEKTVVVDSEAEVAEGLREALDEWRLAKCRDMYESLKEAYRAEYNDEAIDAWIDSGDPEYVISGGKAIPFR